MSVNVHGRGDIAKTEYESTLTNALKFFIFQINFEFKN